jgi:hypothetical protein
MQLVWVEHNRLTSPQFGLFASMFNGTLALEYVQRFITRVLMRWMGTLTRPDNRDMHVNWLAGQLIIDQVAWDSFDTKFMEWHGMLLYCSKLARIAIRLSLFACSLVPLFSVWATARGGRQETVPFFALGPLRVAGGKKSFHSLRLGHYAWRAARNRSVLLGHCAWRAARNRSDWFPAPSSGQALRPAPVMDVGGSPKLLIMPRLRTMMVGGLFTCFLVLLFSVPQFRSSAVPSVLGSQRGNAIS